MRILYDSRCQEDKAPFGALREGEACRVRIRIPGKIRTRRVVLRLLQEDSSPAADFFLKKEAVEGDYDVWRGQFFAPPAALYFYCFEITTEGETFLLYRQGDGDTNMCAGEPWQLTVYPADFKTPSALFGGVMYQIFPDRFALSGRGELTGKIRPFTLHENLSDTPSWEPDAEGEVKNCDFFGGNLKGIEEKLEYLASLGVTVLYLNPIFKAWSNHRYDTADYKRIDELLGDEEDFSSLCRQAHKLGIRILLDGVFSHTGYYSRYFDGDGAYGEGAAAREDSPYRSWFEFQEYPEKYTSWWGIRTLPCVKEEDESYCRYMIEDEDAVCTRWIRLGADGWRLDVADELPDAFLVRFRRRLKEQKPDAFLLGEVWEDASNKVSYGTRRGYFSNGELDSVMNYPWRQAILDLVMGRDDGEAFCRSVMTIAENYPPSVLPLLMNFLSSHDTPRILTLLGGRRPEKKADRAVDRLTREEAARARERLYLASFLQFVLPGLPSIYYGDEVEMQGWEDPFCRRFFPWERKSPVTEHFRTLSALRRTYAPLRGANVRAYRESGAVVLTREGDGSVMRAVANASSEPVFLSLKDGERVVLSRGWEAERGLLSPLGYFLTEKKRVE